MNPEQQRIAIAEVCGYGTVSNIVYWGTPPSPTSSQPWLHDYLNDLNAMATAESIIIKAGAQTIRLYEDALQKSVANIIFATATQRAEAFLRTLNLWEP